MAFGSVLHRKLVRPVEHFDLGQGSPGDQAAEGADAHADQTHRLIRFANGFQQIQCGFFNFIFVVRSMVESWLPCQRCEIGPADLEFNSRTCQIVFP